MVRSQLLYPLSYGRTFTLKEAEESICILDAIGVEALNAHITVTTLRVSVRKGADEMPPLCQLADYRFCGLGCRDRVRVPMDDLSSRLLAT